MSSARTQSGGRQRTLFRTVLPYFNLLLVTGVVVSLGGVTHRITGSEISRRDLEAELVRTRAQLERSQKVHEQTLAEIVSEKDAARRELADLGSDYSQLVTELESRITDIEASASKATSETAATFRQQLESLKSSLAVELKGVQQTPLEVMREFEQDHRAGMVLIYSEFDYFKRRDGKDAKPKTVSGWGSGFFVAKDGLIATNKHVVQPWKFDSDLAAMVALGEIEIDYGSMRISAWRVGDKAVGDDGDPVYDDGFDNHKKRNLRVFAVADDSMEERDMDLGVFGPTYEVHGLDDNDLVILSVRGGAPYHALPLGKSTTLGKLDTVMALGFPRGQNGLECGRAETSPSIGTVRKVENTIHVTTSIIPGNSGGPLVGPDGNVMGIVTRVYSETLGICLKVERVHELIAKGRALEAERLEKAREDETSMLWNGDERE